MTFEELTEKAKSKDDSFLSPIEKVTYVSLRQLIEDFQRGYRTAEQVGLMKSVLKVQHEETTRLHDEAFAQTIRSREALSRSSSTINGIVKAIDLGNRDFEQLFIKALEAYSYAAGETISLKVVLKALKH